MMSILIYHIYVMLLTEIMVVIEIFLHKMQYGNCLKISYSKVSDKIEYANSVDSGSSLFAIHKVF